MVFEYNNGGVDDDKALQHASSWDVYMNDKKYFIMVLILFKCHVLMVKRFVGGW